MNPLSHFDPDANRLEVWLRQGAQLRSMSHINGWTSPRLGIRFRLDKDSLTIFYPDDRPFLSPVELARRMEQAEQRAAREQERAEQAAQRAEQANRRAEQEQRRAELERLRAERLAERLRALGIDPDAAD